LERRTPDPLMIVSFSTGARRVITVSPVNGNVLADPFLNLQTLIPGVASPMQVLPVGNQLWIPDQVADNVTRLTRGGEIIDQLGTDPATGLATGRFNNVRGLGIVNGEVWLCNADAATTGTEATATADTIYRLDPFTGATLGSFPADGMPWAIFVYNGRVLITNSSTDVATEYASDGTRLGVFAQSTAPAMSLPQMMSKRNNGNLWIADFSVAASGLYEFDPVGGPLTRIFLGTGPRAAVDLENGNYIYTDATAVRLRDTANQQTSVLASGNFRYITPLTSPKVSPADIGNTDAEPFSDGAVDNGDFTVFFNAFFAPEASPTQLQADIANTDGVLSPTWPGGGTGGGPDGVVDNGDFTAFFQYFFSPAVLP
jgi:hypothetical protein